MSGLDSLPIHLSGSKMKESEVDYTYEYIAGGMATIDITAEWVDKLKVFEAEERANEIKATRFRYRVYLKHSQGLDVLPSKEPNPLQLICTMESNVDAFKKLDKLTTSECQYSIQAGNRQRRARI
jgi:hypothetical protein